MRKNIFLIIKEAINNILKHASASEILINMSVAGKMIVLQINDNGKGFDCNNLQKGNGLDTMEQRTKSIGGDFVCDSKPGWGTKITVTVPIPHFRYAAS